MLKKSMLTTAATLGIATMGVAAGTAVANADTTYTVQAGDTLSKISHKFANDNSLVNKLAQDNNIQNKDLIYVGQQLTIKDGNDSAATTTSAAAATSASSATSAAASASDQSTTQAASAASAASAQTSAASSQASTTTSSTYTSSVSGSEAAAKEWIANRESGGSYTAQNGQYYGRYQLSLSYLGGDLSAANQEKVADQYVASRYGSWTAAMAFWQANGWY